MAIVADAKAKGQLSISVAALDGLRKTWADTARLAGHDRPADTNIQVNVNTGPTINIVVDKLLAVVDDPATSASKLATALLELDRRRLAVALGRHPHRRDSGDTASRRCTTACLATRRP